MQKCKQTEKSIPRQQFIPKWKRDYMHVFKPRLKLQHVRSLFNKSLRKCGLKEVEHLCCTITTDDTNRLKLNELTYWDVLKLSDQRWGHNSGYQRWLNKWLTWSGIFHLRKILERQKKLKMLKLCARTLWMGISMPPLANKLFPSGL